LRRNEDYDSRNHEIFLYVGNGSPLPAKIHCLPEKEDFFSPTGKIDGLSNAFTKHAKEKFLLPVPEEHNDEVTHFLDEKKINYTKSVMYRTVSNDFDKDEKLDYDMIIF